MDFMSDMESYICIVNLLKHELVSRFGRMPPGIQENYFLEYIVSGSGIPRMRCSRPSRSGNRQSRRCLDLLHGKARGDVLEGVARNQPLVERVRSEEHTPELRSLRH